MRKKLGLSGKLVLMILFSALASAVFLVGMQVVLNKALWLYFDQPETQQRAVEKQVQELQSYIDRRGLSSRDIDKLDDWSVRNGSTMFIIYDRSRMLYSSYPLVAPVYEGRENVTETVPAERWLPMYSLTFSDKETTAMFYYNGVDAYYGKGCEILLLVSFALFPLFFFLSSRKIIRYILLLSGEIQAMEGGDLDHSITIQGDDELALLATSLDGLRLTLRQQQAEEAQAAAKVKSLITEMSHDLRTPLTTLLLYTEILRHHKYETEAQQDEYLAKIDGKARQIKQHLPLEEVSIPSNSPYIRDLMTYDKPTVFFMDMEDVTQSIIYAYMYIDPLKAKEDRPISRLFSAYFGGDMSSLMFQEIREFRSFAYQVNARLKHPPLNRSEKPASFVMKLATQTDKMIDAMEVLENLVHDMPERPERVESVKQTIRNWVNNEYPTSRSLSLKIAGFRREGYESDPNKDYLEVIDRMTMEDILRFYRENIQDHLMIYAIVGNSKSMDMEKLSKFGQIVKVTKKDIYR